MINSQQRVKSLLFCLSLAFLICQNPLQAQTTLSGSTFVQSLSTTNTPTGLTFSNDGLIMLISDNSVNSIIEYNLTSAFDISTASASGNTLATTSPNSYSPSDLKFVNSGNSLIAVGESVDGSFTQYVYIYPLSTAYDITSVGTPENATLSSETWVTGVTMNTTGDAFYICDKQNDEVVPYTLTTAYTLGTPTRGTPVSISDIDDPQALRFNDDGSRLFIVDQDAAPDFTGSVWTYTLSTSYDVSGLSSATEELTFDIASQGLEVLNDAAKFFIVGDNSTSDFFYEYNLDVDTQAPTLTDGDTNPSVVENTTAVDTYAADETVTWSITGVDADLLDIDVSTGELTFNSAPDFENPEDADEDNDYLVTVTATDESDNATDLSVTITVTDADEVAPSGYSVAFDDDNISATEAPTATFTVTNGEAGATYSYGILDGEGGSVISSGTQTSDTEQFEVDLSDIAAGELTLSFALTDAAGNSGDAVTATANLDLTAPSLNSLEALDSEENEISATNGVDITFLFTFSESITGFDESDFSVTHADITNISTTDNTSSVVVTPTGEDHIAFNATGEVSDIAGNTLTLEGELTITYDAESPTATVTSTTSSPTNNNPIPFELSFSESISGFDLNDASQLTLTNGTLMQNEDESYFNEATAGTTYTFSVIPSADGSVSATAAAGIVTDVANNTNSASETASIDYDGTSPQATITFPGFDGTITNTSPIEVSITFDEDVFLSGGTSAWDGSTGLSINNGAIEEGSFTSTDNSEYGFSITPDAEGVISIDLANTAVVDDAGNSNDAKSVTVNYDISGPKIESVAPASGGTVSESFTLSITFDEEVTGFNASEDLTITNGTLGEASATEGQTFEMILTPIEDGEITVSLVANAVSDQLGQTNEAAESFFEITYDSPFSGGSGTEEDPFLISVLEDLKLLSEDRSYWQENYFFQQTADITFDNSFTFRPIGMSGAKFTGTYDGGGFEIADLVIGTTEEDRFDTIFELAFFGRVETAVVKNLALTNISVKTNVEDFEDNSLDLVQAGLVGTYANLTVTGCRVSGEITTDILFSYVAGFAGLGDPGSNLIMTNCRNDASISGSFAGGMDSGGRSGSNYIITGCVNSGTINGAIVAAGILGSLFLETNAIINNCYNLGDLNSNQVAGIFLGTSEGSVFINNCYNAGRLLQIDQETGQGVVDPIALVSEGTSAITLSGCLYDTDINDFEITAQEGKTGLSTAQLQDPDHLTSVHGWDFLCETENGELDTWTIPDLRNPGSSYPALSWEHPDHDCDDILNSPSAETAIRVYPNPTNGIVHLQTSGSIIESIAIYNASGKTLDLIPYTTGSEHILDLSEQKAGLYYIQVVEASQSKTLKVIVEK